MGSRIIHLGRSGYCRKRVHTRRRSQLNACDRPFPYPGHFHIPFSLEETCSSIPVVPQEERVDEAIILGKLTRKPTHLNRVSC